MSRTDMTAEIKKADVSELAASLAARSDRAVDEWERQYEAEQRKRAFFACGIKPRERVCSFSSYRRDTPARDRAWRTVRTLCEELKRGAVRNVIMYGGSGSGKTHLAVSLIRELLEERKGEVHGLPLYFSCCYRNWYELADMVQNPRLIDKMTRNDLCVLDDVGQYDVPRISFPNLFWKVMNSIYENGGSGIFITNIKIHEFMEAIPEAAKSRLNYGRNCLLVDFTSIEDFRVNEDAIRMADCK